LEKSQKEEERKQKLSLAVKLASYMKQNGASTEEISKETGLSPETIMGL
jgi:DNA-binding transcriptional regulator LsrR (DeoR family)